MVPHAPPSYSIPQWQHGGGAANECDTAAHASCSAADHFVELRFGGNNEWDEHADLEPGTYLCQHTNDTSVTSYDEVDEALKKELVAFDAAAASELEAARAAMLEPYSPWYDPAMSFDANTQNLLAPM